MSAHLLALLALVGVHSADRQSVANAMDLARTRTARQDRPSEEVVVAIIEHESHGDPRLCKNENDGSSSRGLMQINHKDSRCDDAGDAMYEHDYNPWHNVAEGIQILATQHAWHLTHCKHPHDVLEHYAGTGPLAKKFARDIRRRAQQLRPHPKGHHGRR